VFGNCCIGWLPLNGLRLTLLGDVGFLDSGSLGVKYVLACLLGAFTRLTGYTTSY